MKLYARTRQGAKRDFVITDALARRIGVVLALLAVFSAAAAELPTKNTGTGEGRVAAKVAPQTRADFIAAMEFIKAGVYNDGIALLNKVAAQSGGNPAPYINLALAYKKIGYDDQAKKNLEHAIEIDPENPVANNEYALLQRKAGKFSEARQLYEKILEKYPNSVIVHKNMGVLCDLYLGDYDCALKHYSVYSDSMPDDITVKNWISGIRK